ncbi:MAG TPA: glycerophosphodiester phosphodiesterase [Mycobacteriales bacterium]|nr:glycerophosphodiester phosphodiesterase [Mycobacteriales bacterium]
MLAVAHRAGNDLQALREAAVLGADVVEADVHLRRGRLEVRHLKSMGPLPWLWDRWELHPAGVDQLMLSDLLDALPTGQTVMLDLKGVGRVGPETLRVLEARSVEHPLLVCARWWPSSLAFAHVPWAEVLLSARGRTELARLRRLLRSGRPPYGVSVHLSVLTPALVREIQGAGTLVLSWPVDDAVALERARELGVDGAITKDLGIVRELVASR